MGRGVRATRQETIRELSDDQLDAYIAETKRRVATAAKAAIRDNYERQLRLAELVRAERSA